MDCHHGNAQHEWYGVMVHSACWPVSTTCTATAHCGWYPELSHWRRFGPSYEISPSSTQCVSTRRKYGGALCFCTHDGRSTESIHPVLAWICNTDHQNWQLRWWDPVTCNKKCWMASIGFNRHSLCLWINRCFFPDHSLCNSLQQAQDAVTMVTAMWKMMSSMLQQEQRRVYPGYGPGTPGTDLYQTAGTPEVLPDRCLRAVGTPRFPTPT